jgi:hypothetical protein
MRKAPPVLHSSVLLYQQRSDKVGNVWHSKHASLLRQKSYNVRKYFTKVYSLKIIEFLKFLGHASGNKMASTQRA